MASEAEFSAIPSHPHKGILTWENDKFNIERKKADAEEEIEYVFIHVKFGKLVKLQSLGMYA